AIRWCSSACRCCSAAWRWWASGCRRGGPPRLIRWWRCESSESAPASPDGAAVGAWGWGLGEARLIRSSREIRDVGSQPPVPSPQPLHSGSERAAQERGDRSVLPRNDVAFLFEEDDFQAAHVLLHPIACFLRSQHHVAPAGN